MFQLYSISVSLLSEPWTVRFVEISGGQSAQPLAQSRSDEIRIGSTSLLNTSRDGDSTAFMGHVAVFDHPMV